MRIIKKILTAIKKLINMLKGSSEEELPDEGEMNMYGFYAPSAHNYGRTTQNGFGGINANKSADNGEVLSLIDMTSDEYPLLATRPQRWRCGTYEGHIVGYGVSNGVRAYVTKNGSEFKFHYAENEIEFTADESIEKISIAAVGDYVILLPVMLYFDIRSLSVMTFRGEDYNANFVGEFPDTKFQQTISYSKDGDMLTHTFAEGELFMVLPLEEELPVPDVPGPEYDAYLENAAPEGMYIYNNGSADFQGYQFGSMRNKYEGKIGFYMENDGTQVQIGTYSPTAAEFVAFRKSFRTGDAIRISNCTHEKFNKTVVIRKMQYLPGLLKAARILLDDNTFEIPEGEEITETYNTELRVVEAHAVLERDIPALDIIFEHNNRVWGASGRSIYCSKVGDPLIWSDYESLADGCWWADTGNTEPHGITGGTSYTYPRFFSEKCIYTIYGDTPGEFTIVPTRTHGVTFGANESLAVVNGMLIYLSPNGFMGYTGSLPQKLDYALGIEPCRDAMSVSDGVKYYAYAQRSDGMHLFVYDTARQMWEEERFPDEIEGLWNIEDTTIAIDGHFWTLGNVREKPIDEGETEEYFGDEVLGKVVFADFTMDSVSKKQLKEIVIRHDIGGSLTVKLYIDDVLDESFTKTLTGAGKKTTVLPCAPKRCDHWHLELEGEGPWLIYSIAAAYMEGSTK